MREIIKKYNGKYNIIFKDFCIDIEKELNKKFNLINAKLIRFEYNDNSLYGVVKNEDKNNEVYFHYLNPKDRKCNLYSFNNHSGWLYCKVIDKGNKNIYCNSYQFTNLVNLVKEINQILIN